MSFDLSAMLKEVSESDTVREQIEYIRLDLLDSDEQNFYELSEVPALADNIATVGLQQPLRVRKHPEAEGRYLIVSGHRRRAAVELLAKDEPERWAEVACIVQQAAASPALQQLQLIYANSGTRKLSGHDLSEQAVQVEKLLYQLQEEGHEFPGRMRDHVAKVMQTTNTKLATLKKIREHLAECWMPLYKKGKLPENTAYELAKIPYEDQQVLFEVRMSNDPRLGSFRADDAKFFSKECKGIEKLKCKHGSSDGKCQNVKNKKKRAAALHYYSTCYCTKCCSDCVDLINCKYACPLLADKVKQKKADRKEANRQAKLDREEKDRPAVDKISALWQRFGLAREMSFKEFDDCKRAMGIYYFPYDNDKAVKLECGEAKISPATKLPFGYSCYLPEISRLIALADLFDCSLDYLLCRTDVKEMAQIQEGSPRYIAEKEPQKCIPGAWYPASVEPPCGEEIIMIDRTSFVDSDVYLGSGQLKNPVTTEWKDVALWSPMPKKSTSSSLDEPPADGWHPLAWISGQDLPVEPVRAIAVFDMCDGYPPVELSVRWMDDAWKFKDGVAVTGKCLRWYPLPPEEIPGNAALNNGCKTGMSPSGHCGAAAYCEEPVDCCMNCGKLCNLRCGHMEV